VEQETKAIPHQQNFFPFSSFLWMTGSHINRWGTTNLNHPTTKQGHPTKTQI
jgi:hypothetical protein